MFDRDQSGTINFQEFSDLWKYIQQWKGVFDRYDADRSGAIEAQELHRAFTEMGFRLSFNFCQLVMFRYVAPICDWKILFYYLDIQPYAENLVHFSILKNQH